MGEKYCIGTAGSNKPLALALKIVLQSEAGWII
jgi:hypothetical protein